MLLKQQMVCSAADLTCSPATGNAVAGSEGGLTLGIPASPQTAAGMCWLAISPCCQRGYSFFVGTTNSGGYATPGQHFPGRLTPNMLGHSLVTNNSKCYVQNIAVTNFTATAYARRHWKRAGCSYQ